MTAVDEVQELAKATIDELRTLVQGIHPRVLTDRGIAAAIVELTGQAAQPVDLDLELPYRFGEAVEAAAYFSVAEAVTNAVKHGAADRITVSARHAVDQLHIAVRDDGVGGADPAAGSGLRGLVDRVEAVDGTLTVSSPDGGPTLVVLDIPCRVKS